jgi:hypothetical protein
MVAAPVAVPNAAHAQTVSEITDSNGDVVISAQEGWVGINRDFSIGKEAFGVQAEAGANTYGGMYMETTSPDGYPFYGYATDGSLKMWTEYQGSTGRWYVYNGGRRLTVQSDGNVGIGTTNPSSLLTVDGMVESTSANTRGELGTADYGVHGVSTSNTENAGYFEMSTSTGTALLGIHRGDGNATYGLVEGAGSAVLGQTDANASGDAVVGSALGSGFSGVFEGSKSQSAQSPGAHIALIENTGGSEGDGLAIQSGANTNPGSADNFLTFFDGDGDAVGAIEGNGSGGINMESGGSDYAEELPVAQGASKPEPKSLVGVQSGKVSLSTEEVDRIMIVSGQPAVTGNAIPSTRADDAERVPVAFIGQVPVRLQGTAQAGDLIIASGDNDGTARAISSTDYHPSSHGPIAGQAWSSKSAEGIGEVTVAVGLSSSSMAAQKLETQRQRNDSQEERIAELEDRLAALEAETTSPAAASLMGSWGLALLLGIGGLAGGILWRRSA